MSLVQASGRRSSILHRDLNGLLPTVVRGTGVHLIDSEGKYYLDASGGAAVSCLGHSDPRVIEAVQRQIATLPFAHTSFFTNEPSETLAHVLIDRAPKGFGRGRVEFLSSGSESVEAALKLARQYFVEKGQSTRYRIISRRMSYHGNTLGALAVGGHAGRRKMYQPMLADTFQISPCYAYRLKDSGETAEAYGQRMALELEAEIERLGPKTVAAFIAEPVVGATLGSVPAVIGYFKKIRSICDHYGVLLIADEIMCGMGRCGSLFAMEHEDVTPDIITIAKGLGAGYQPIGAVLGRESIITQIESGTGLLAHGHTYMSHAVACAGALAVLNVIESDGLLDKVQTMGRALETALRETFEGHPNIGDIRGRGLFWSLELVKNKETKEPFPVGAKVSSILRQSAQEEGLICYPASGTADGINGDHVLLAPPFIVTHDQIGEIVDKLSKALKKTLSSVLQTA